MVSLDIPENPNCEAVDMRVFNDLAPARPVAQVRLEPQPGRPQWCHVIGWNLDGTTTPATACKVDDSGEGVVFLIAGGTAGLRLQPATAWHPWRLDDPAQWGAPFFLLADAQDIRYNSSHAHG